MEWCIYCTVSGRMDVFATQDAAQREADHRNATAGKWEVSTMDEWDGSWRGNL